MNELDDAALIRRYVEQGDREAMGQLFSRHADTAYRTALRYLRNPSEAEDAVQAAFVKAMQTASACRGGAGVRAWLMRIVGGTCVDMMRSSARRRNREQVIFEGQPQTTEAQDSGVELAGLVKQQLEQLPERYRIPIWLHHGEGLAFNEIAEALSVSEATLRSQASRGIEMLRGNLIKAGASVPAASILAVFPLFSAEAAPAGLVESIAQMVSGTGIFSNAVLGAKALPGAGAGVSAAKVAGLAGVVAGSAAVVGTTLWMNKPLPDRMAGLAPATAPPIVEPSVKGETVYYHWDFNSGAPQEFKTIYGSWRHIPDGGPDGSGCIENDNEATEILIDVPIRRLPVEVTYRRSCVFPPPELGFTTKVFWQSYGPVVQFFGLVDVPATPALRDGQSGPWFGTREFVTDAYVDRYAREYHADLTVGRRIGDSRLRITLRGRHRIDDLTIRSVAESEIPDVSRYLRAIDNIPPEKRTGTVVLPDLKPGRDQKQVRVTFVDGRP